MTREDWMLLALGVLVLTRRRVDWGDGWMWPLASVRKGGKLYRPIVTSRYGEPRGSELHAGVDVTVAKEVRDLGTIPVLAARAGKVWSCQLTKRGWAVTLDHSHPFATFYTHMKSVALVPHAGGVNSITGAPTYVKAGDILGTMGHDPLDAERVPHLHFEVWYEGTSEQSIDPADAMKTWPYSPLVVNG